jgi:hypothetical protein
MPSAFVDFFILWICVGIEKLSRLNIPPCLARAVVCFSIYFTCLKAGTNATVNPRRPRLVIPLCVHSIRTPAVIRLPYVEK